MRVLRVVALLIITVAGTLHGAVDHAPSAFTRKESVIGATILVRSSPSIFEAKSSVQGLSAFTGGRAQAA